jgi:microcystin-dependent protein
MAIFGTGNGVGDSYATVLLTFPNVDWYKWNIAGAINQLTLDFNWSEDGDVGVSFAIEEAKKTLEGMVFMAFNPIPIGLIHPYASSVLPDGYLLCDGATVAAADYPELFAVIGYSFGGAGADFNLPDLVDRTIIGSSGSFAFGTTGGDATVTLDVSEMPAHSHTDTGHVHTIPLITSAPAQAGVGFAGNVTVPLLTMNTGTASANLTDTGGGGAHENMQPYIALSYIIYAGR